MTVDAEIFNALKVIPQILLDDGSFAVYPDEFPQEPDVPVWPAIRYVIAGGTIHEDICGDGDEETDDVRVQIDVVSVDSVERRAIMSAVRVAMKVIPGAVMQAPPVFSKDSETKTYRAMADWMIQGSSS